jgi:hypothetical protein
MIPERTFDAVIVGAVRAEGSAFRAAVGVTRLRKAEQCLPQAGATLEQDAGVFAAVAGILCVARSRLRGSLGPHFKAPRETPPAADFSKPNISMMS